MKAIFESKSERIAHALIVFLMVLCCGVVILPFLNIIAVSLSGRQAVISGKVTVWPVDFSMEAYAKVVENDYFFRAYGNTLFVVIVGTAITMVLTIMAAFIVSRRDLPGQGAITVLITLTMWFSGGMIPTFLIVRQVGLYDNLFALILPSAISAYNVIVMRSFFRTIPDSLIEASRIDGCSEFGTYRRIIMPMAKPAYLTVLILMFQQLWNQNNADYVYNENLKTLPYALTQITTGGLIRTGAAQAVGVLMLIVPAAVFIVNQTKIIDTMATSGIKE